MIHLHIDLTYGDCNVYSRDRCKLRVTETGAARKARETIWAERAQKDFCIVFLGAFEGAFFCPVHPTFMPIKQLELKH